MDWNTVDSVRKRYERGAAGAWYSVVPGMLGAKQGWYGIRNIVAAYTAFLFSFASFAPIAASTFTDSTPTCCHGGKCCRKNSKSNPATGPILASRSCCDGAGQVALSPSAANGVVRPCSSTLVPPADITDRVTAARSAARTELLDDVRRQRPPPSSLS